MESLERPTEQILATYARATEKVPTRAEALHGAARYCRIKNLFEQGYQFATEGLKIAKPSGGLFVEPWIYDYALLDELGVCAYWTQRYGESLDAYEKILTSGALPSGERDRILANAEFSRLKLAEAVPFVKTTDAKPLKIAIYTIALDEAKHVDRWYQSTADADYRVVADTGSTDQTVELLRQRGVQVAQISVQPWRFDDARNASLALVPADADICIALDMDEFLMPGWRDKIVEAWTPGTTRLYHQHARGFNPDGSASTVFRKSKIHSRRGYRWKRIVHEDLQRTEPDEKTQETGSILIGEIQDIEKSRGQYLTLMEQAHQEDPNDCQLCFWLARELMYVSKKERSIEVHKKFLRLENAWPPERAEAMRHMARLEPGKTLEWLLKAICETPHRRELWLDLAEYHHSTLNWLELLLACKSGLERTQRTGSYLDEPYAWGYRLHDLAALACSHLGLIDQAIEYGTKAVELMPGDQRLSNNLKFYSSQK